VITFAEGAANAFRGATCALLAGSDSAYRLFGGALLDPGNAGNVAAALRRQICNGDPDDDPGTPDPPFTGGQCPKLYQLNFTLLRTNDGATNGGSDTALGPIGPLYENRSFGGTAKGTGVFVSDGSGGRVERNFLSFSDPDRWSITSFNVVPITGADDCGDPPIDIEPGPQTQPVSITYNVDESTEVTVEGDLVISPVFVGINGKLFAPIQVDLGGIEWSGNIELSPDFTVNINPKGINEGPGTVDNPGDLDEPSEDTPAPTEPPPPGETIIGVIVRCTIPGENNLSAIDATNIPDIYVPRLGSVSFQIDTGGTVAWTPDQDIKNLNCYIPCPAPQGATSVGVSLRPGVTGTYSAVRGQPLTPS